jgi:hypothetical protein
MPNSPIDAAIRPALTEALSDLRETLTAEQAANAAADAASWWSVVELRSREWHSTPAWTEAAKAVLSDETASLHINRPLPSGAGELECGINLFLASVVTRAVVHAGGLELTDDAFAATLADLQGYFASNELPARIAMPLYGLDWSGEEPLQFGARTVITPLAPDAAAPLRVATGLDEKSDAPMRWQLIHQAVLTKSPGATAADGDWISIARLLRQSVLDYSMAIKPGYLAVPLAQLTLERWVPGPLGIGEAGGVSVSTAFEAPDSGRSDWYGDNSRDALVEVLQQMAGGR